MRRITRRITRTVRKVKAEPKRCTECRLMEMVTDEFLSVEDGRPILAKCPNREFLFFPDKIACGQIEPKEQKEVQNDFN